MNANAPAFDATKSPSQSGRRGRCERGMALAAAVSPMAAESHGEEFGVHGDAISIFVCARLDLRDVFWRDNSARSSPQAWILFFLTLGT